jgi:hypothetical protein
VRTASSPVVASALSTGMTADKGRRQLSNMRPTRNLLSAFPSLLCTNRDEKLAITAARAENVAFADFDERSFFEAEADAISLHSRMNTRRKCLESS